jgi:hypothetical protein
MVETEMVCFRGGGEWSIWRGRGRGGKMFAKKGMEEEIETRE